MSLLRRSIDRAVCQNLEMLKLRPLTLADEAEFLAARDDMARTDDWMFALSYEPGMPWGEYVELHENIRLGVNLPDGLVRAAFLVAEVDGTIVGRASLRFGLNEFLLRQGGHIGYGVLAAHRRNGYATDILRQSLIITRSEGVDPALVCCEDENHASAAVIERCGGRLENIVEGDGGEAVRRYWI